MTYEQTVTRQEWTPAHGDAPVTPTLTPPDGDATWQLVAVVRDDCCLLYFWQRTME